MKYDSQPRVAITLVLLIFLIAQPARAWLHIEPFVGYNRGQVQGTQMQGLGAGARVGFDFGPIFLVADGEYDSIQQGALNYVTYTDFGPTMGGTYQFMRVWYGLISNASFSYTQTGASYTESGNGSKIGLGAAVGTSMQINLETRFYNFNLLNTGGISDLGTVGFLSISWLL